MPRRALEITADICAALEFSHRHGIIHRDVKPGNVMLTQTGQVKVMDFGIARALASGATTMTQTSAVIGTAQYLSPEQARGEAVDARSDVYATGCVLYELLTGHPPFVGDNPVSVAYQHVREDPQPPSDSNRDVPPEVDAVVLKALAKNRMNRYQSAGEMRADLLRATAGRPVMATPVMREVERGMPLAPPPPRVAGPRTTGVVARVGNPQRRRASTWALVGLTLLGVLAVAALGAGIWLANRTPTAVVPSLVGKTKDEAEASLQGVNLGGAPKAVTNCQTTGKVMGQNPAAGQHVPQRSFVSYDVCEGPGKVIIPNLANATKADAQSQLTKLGLNPSFDHVDSAQPLDTVVSTDPAIGSTVTLGAKVVVHLSSHNEGNLPDVTQQAAAAAKAALRNAGFTTIRSVDQIVTDPAQVGIVQAQSPQGNSTRKFTDTIRIFVGVLGTPASPSPQPQSPPASSPAA
jgi:serine/threonine-protein kinase